MGRIFLFSYFFHRKTSEIKIIVRECGAILVGVDRIDFDCIRFSTSETIKIETNDEKNNNKNFYT